MSKSQLLWALLALSPLAFAEPANTPQTARAASGYANEYLMRELGARMSVPQGKTIQPDKPSKNYYSAQQREALRTVFGSENPLLAKRQPAGGGRINYSLSLPAGHYQDASALTIWDQGDMQVAVAPNGSQVYSGSLPSLSSLDKAGRFDIKAVSAKGHSMAGSWGGKAHGEIAQVSYTPHSDAHKGFSLEHLRYDSDYKRQGQYISGGAEYSIGRASAEGQSIDQLHLSLRWRQLDAAALAGLKLEADRLRTAGWLTADGDEFLNRSAPMLKRLLMGGAALEIEDLSGSYRGQKLTVKGKLALPNAKDADFSSGPALLNKLVGRLEIAVPQQLLREIAATMAEQYQRSNPGMETPLDKLTAQFYEAMSSKALASNYVRQDKDMLRTLIELKDGVVTINGNALPPEVLLKLFGKGKVPPADTEAPVAITMRQRGLQAAQQFAESGDGKGMLELCQRMVDGFEVDRDLQKANEWCGKAWDKSLYAAAIPLGEPFLNGELNDPAIPRRLQEAADKQHLPEAQFLMSRLHREGKGVPKDLEKAGAYLQQSADQGYLKAFQAKVETDAGKRSASPDSKSGEDGAAAAAAAAVANPWNLLMQVEAGFISEQSYRFDSDKHRRLDVSLDKLKTHEKWAPLLAVCLSANNPSDVACFRLIAYKGEKPRLQASSDISGNQSEQRHNIQALATSFEPGENVDLTVYASGKQVHFVVNGKESLVQDVDFPAEVLTLHCSTGDCNFNFLPAP